MRRMAGETKTHIHLKDIGCPTASLWKQRSMNVWVCMHNFNECKMFLFECISQYCIYQHNNQDFPFTTPYIVVCQCLVLFVQLNFVQLSTRMMCRGSNSTAPQHQWREMRLNRAAVGSLLPNTHEEVHYHASVSSPPRTRQNVRA